MGETPPVSQRPTPHTRRPSKPKASLPLYAVIMAGGEGTRFWPHSRRRNPKQLLRLTGRHSLLQETARRMRRLVPWKRILVVTNQLHAAAVRRQLPKLDRQQILVEPQGRNTLPCAALAAEWVAQRDAEAVLIVAPADHVINDVQGWRRAMETAVSVAVEHSVLVTCGVVPTRPETGYGYIEIGPALRRRDGVSWVRRFREKPGPGAAARYAASQRFLWNSGVFVWRLSTFRSLVQQCAPAVAGALRGVWQLPPNRRATALRAAYRKVPDESLDVGLLEPASRRRGAAQVAVVRAGFDWSDVGSWGALPEVLEQDGAGNVVSGRVIAIDAHDTVVVGADRLIALVGLRDVIVVDSGDALLVCARNRAQEVRLVTEELRRRGWRQLL